MVIYLSIPLLSLSYQLSQPLPQLSLIGLLSLLSAYLLRLEGNQTRDKISKDKEEDRIAALILNIKEEDRIDGQCKDDESERVKEESKSRSQRFHHHIFIFFIGFFRSNTRSLTLSFSSLTPSS